MSVPVKIYRTTTYQEGQTPSNPNIGGDPIYNPLNPNGGATEELVPYEGAIKEVNLGERGLTSGYVKLDTTPTNTPSDQGTISWSVAKSTAQLVMNGTTQHIGQDSYYYVKNSTGSNIPKGTAVRFAGTDGASGHILIAPFLADGTFPSAYFMGVTSEPIANGEFGQVQSFGELTGVNTSGYSAGALLYASTTVAGGFQTTTPIAPNNIVLIAAAINSKNNGDIIIRPTIGSNINNDEGVKIVSPATGDLLQRQSNGLFENRTVDQVIGTLASKWTNVGSDIYRNSRVLIGGTTFDHANSILEIQHSTDNYVKGLTIVNSRSWGYGSRITFRVPLASGVGDPADAAAIEQNYDSSNNYNLSFYTTTSGSLTLKAVLNSGGNFLLGGSTDSGQRLQVTGNVALRASSTSSPATQIPVFVADPASTNRELVTRTPAQLASDMGVITQSTGGFTPTLIDSSSGFSYNLLSSFGDYVKIGKLVYVSIQIRITSTSGSTSGGFLRIGNLPFQYDEVSSSTINGSTSLIEFSGSSLSSAEVSRFRFTIVIGASYMQLTYIDGGSVNAMSLSAGGRIILSAVYTTA